MSTDEPDAEDLAEAFPHVAQLEEQLKEADIDVGDIPQRKGTTRRDLLAGSAGLLGLGGILTGATGGAQAGDDQAGQFGTQAAPLDGYVEDLYDKNGNRVAELPGDGSLDVLQEMSAESVSTDDLTGAYPGKVRAVGGGEVVASIDPSTTSTPVADACAALNSAGVIGEVLVSGSVNEDAPLSNLYGNVVRGVGGGKSQLTFNLPDSTTPGVDLQRGSGVYDQDGGFENLILYGGGFSSDSNVAILARNGDYEGFTLDRVIFNNWGGGAFHDDGVDSSLYNMDWGFVQATNIGGDVFNFGALGIANSADTILVSGGISGRAWVHEDFGEFHISGFNMSDTGYGPNGEQITLGAMAEGRGTTFEHINAEAAGNTGAAHAVYHAGGGHKVERLENPNSDYSAGIVAIAGGGAFVGKVSQSGSAPDLIEVVEDTDFPDHAAITEHESSEVNNTTGSTLTNPISCLGDQVLKTSTGTGP